MMYNEIEDLQEFDTAGSAPYLNMQLVHFGLTLIKNINDFEKALEEWYDLPVVNQMWLDFKAHFTFAQDKLCCVCGPTMRNATFNHQANIKSKLLLDKIFSIPLLHQESVFWKLSPIIIIYNLLKNLPLLHYSKNLQT